MLCCGKLDGIGRVDVVKGLEKLRNPCSDFQFLFATLFGVDISTAKFEGGEGFGKAGKRCG